MTGNRELSIDEVFAAAAIPSTASLPFLDIAAVQSRLRSLPLISEASVRKLYPDKLALFGSGAVQLTFGGTADAIIVRYGYEQNFWGAVMPARVETYAEPFPAWCVEDDFTPKPEESEGGA